MKKNSRSQYQVPAEVFKTLSLKIAIVVYLSEGMSAAML